MIKFDNELAEQYQAECLEHLANMETYLLDLEKGRTELDGERMNRASRAVNSIKEGADALDLVKICELAHRTEDVLTLIRSRKIVPTPVHAGILLRAADRLHELIEDVGTSDHADIDEVMSALATLHADHRACAERGSHAGAGGTQQAGRHLRMLLVEDDFASRLLLQTFLSHYGECHVAVNGREAVEAFRSAFERGQRYDLICMDIMMPEMDGREALRQVRALEKGHGILSSHGAKIIMTTAMDDIREVSRCFEELCDAYLVKPIDLAKLLNQMKAYQLVQ